MNTAQVENRTERKHRVIHLATRWDMVQTSERTFDVMVPVGNLPLLHIEAIKAMNLTDREVETAEDAVLRSVAIVQ